MLKGFKDFLLRGNVVDLAVAVVIGAAFTAVVTAFTNAFLKPLIQLFSGGGEFAGKFVVNDVEFDYASFINSAFTFVLTAAVVYFLVVYPMKWLQDRRRRGEEAGPAESTDVELLAEIRDLLQAQADAASIPTSSPTATPSRDFSDSADSSDFSSSSERTTRLSARPNARPGSEEQGYEETPERRPARPRLPRSRHSTGADAPRR